MTEPKVAEVKNVALDLAKSNTAQEANILEVYWFPDPNEVRIIEIDGYHFDIDAQGNMIVINHTDEPGVIGEVGTILGQLKINIASMQVGRKKQGGNAIMVINVDSVEPEITAKLEKAKTVSKARVIHL